MKKTGRYDKYLHEIQKPKMQEIWDNEYDGADSDKAIEKFK